MTDTTKTLAELVSDWETAKAMTEDAALSMRNANANHERCALAQKAAYKAMNEAIDALRPKRKIKPVVTQDGTKIEPTPLEEAIAATPAISMVA